MNIKKISTVMMAFVLSMFLFSCEGDVGETDAEIIDQISKKWSFVEKNVETGDESDFGDVIISAGTGANEILMTDFYHLSEPTVAIVSGKTILIKPSSEPIDGYTIDGTGIISDDYESISFSYNVVDLGGEESFTSVFIEYDPTVTKKAEKVQ